MLTNTIAEFLNKSPEDFQRSDLVDYIQKNNIHFVHFRYPAVDGRLKTLRLPLVSKERTEQILGDGERVDGSSLFKSLLDSTRSDLYAVPIYETAFINPFLPDVMDICCCYINQKGDFEPLTPPAVLHAANGILQNTFGMTLNALTELEFYLLSKPNRATFNATKQQAYHESEPFMKGSSILHEMAQIVAKCTGTVKYAHAEVGFIPEIKSDNPEIDGCMGEQYEIEFLPAPIEKMAYNTLVAKWIIRTVAHRHGTIATFTPKLQEGMAGTGMHVHVELRKNGKNVMVENKELSKYARCAIGGLCKFAPTLTAFGNTIASSYLRLVPHQEAPTRIFWSENNRAALVREPLGWVCAKNLDCKANPRQEKPYQVEDSKQTVELRSPDGSANVFLLLAGMTTGICDALDQEKGLEVAKAHYIPNKPLENASEVYEKLGSLPPSCEDSADLLIQNRQMYEKIMPAPVIDYMAAMLKNQKDKTLYQTLQMMNEEEKNRKKREIMHKDIHIG